MTGAAPDAQHRGQDDHKDGAHHRQEDPHVIIWLGERAERERVTLLEGAQETHRELEGPLSLPAEGMRLQVGLGGPSLPTGTPPNVCCERYYLETHVLGKKGTGTPLQGGSYPVSSWLSFPVDGEIPARIQGAWGRGFHSGSATLCHETMTLKNNFRAQLTQSVHSADEAQRGEDTCLEVHSWWTELR